MPVPALGAHPSPLGIGVLSRSWSVAPPSSQTSPNVDGCVVQGPIGMPLLVTSLWINTEGPPKAQWIRLLSGVRLFFLLFSRSGVTNTPRAGVVNCAQVEFLGIPFRSQRTPSPHPSPLGIGVLSSFSVAPPGS